MNLSSDPQTPYRPPQGPAYNYAEDRWDLSHLTSKQLAEHAARLAKEEKTFGQALWAEMARRLSDGTR